MSRTLFSVPAPTPDGEGGPPPALVEIGVITALTTTFFGLVGQGYPAKDALLMTLGLGAGGALITRLRSAGQNGGGDQ